jgi:hypothetical protein
MGNAVWNSCCSRLESDDGNGPEGGEAERRVRSSSVSRQGRAGGAALHAFFRSRDDRLCPRVFPNLNHSPRGIARLLLDGTNCDFPCPILLLMYGRLEDQRKRQGPNGGYKGSPYSRIQPYPTKPLQERLSSSYSADTSLILCGRDNRCSRMKNYIPKRNCQGYFPPLTEFSSYRIRRFPERLASGLRVEEKRHL